MAVFLSLMLRSNRLWGVVVTEPMTLELDVVGSAVRSRRHFLEAGRAVPQQS